MLAGARALVRENVGTELVDVVGVGVGVVDGTTSQR